MNQPAAKWQPLHGPPSCSVLLRHVDDDLAWEWAKACWVSLGLAPTLPQAILVECRVHIQWGGGTQDPVWSMWSMCHQETRWAHRSSPCPAFPLAQRLLRNRYFLPPTLSPGAYHLSSHTEWKISAVLSEDGRAAMVPEFSSSLVEFEASMLALGRGQM